MSFLAKQVSRSSQLHTEIQLHSLCARSTEHQLKEILLGGAGWEHLFLGPGTLLQDVRRKGSIPMSPQNGFWVIRLYKGEYYALSSPKTLLTVRGKPLSVGVSLDYEARGVSFYDMTDRFHIFTFHQNTFCVVLKPLFRLWSSGHLSICPGEGK